MGWVPALQGLALVCPFLDLPNQKASLEGEPFDLSIVLNHFQPSILSLWEFGKDSRESYSGTEVPRLWDLVPDDRRWS